MTAVCYIRNLFWKLYTMFVLKYWKNEFVIKRILFSFFWLTFLFYLQKLGSLLFYKFQILRQIYNILNDANFLILIYFVHYALYIWIDTHTLILKYCIEEFKYFIYKIYIYTHTYTQWEWPKFYWSPQKWTERMLDSIASYSSQELWRSLHRFLAPAMRNSHQRQSNSL